MKEQIEFCTAAIILHEKHIERKTGKALSFSEVG